LLDPRENGVYPAAIRKYPFKQHLSKMSRAKSGKNRRQIDKKRHKTGTRLKPH
jgi:hypothetical protein